MKLNKIIKGIHLGIVAALSAGLMVAACGESKSGNSNIKVNPQVNLAFKDTLFSIDAGKYVHYTLFAGSNSKVKSIKSVKIQRAGEAFVNSTYDFGLSVNQAEVNQLAADYPSDFDKTNAQKNLERLAYVALSEPTLVAGKYSIQIEIELENGTTLKVDDTFTVAQDASL